MRQKQRKQKEPTPSLKPQAVKGDGWYYESRRGIEIYRASGCVAVIPWWKLMRSATRCGWAVRYAR
jgi:hypothetical protein